MIVELISRTGSPTTDSLSPYNGMQSVACSQLKYVNIQNAVSMLMRGKKDYDADHQKPKVGVRPPDYKVALEEGEYLRRLEDIDESWIRKYIENVLTGLKKDKRGGIREYEAENVSARMFRNEDDEEVEECELLIEKQEYSPLSIAEAKSKLPYLLKRLHDKSIALGVSALSLIITYEKAKINRGAGTVRPIDMLHWAIYRVNTQGDITTAFPSTANSGKVFPVAFAWISGRTKDTYFYDAMEFLHVCEILGIDIRSEDPRDFQSEEIANMQVTYITKNKEYLSGLKKYNRDVLNGISKMSVSEYVNQSVSTQAIADAIQDTIQAVNDCIELNMQSLPADKMKLEAFFEQYVKIAPEFKIRGNIPTLEDFQVVDGFLYSKRCVFTPQTFRVQKYSDAGSTKPALMHISGYLFFVLRDNTLVFQDAEEVAKCVRDNYIGKWRTCFA